MDIHLHWLFILALMLTNALKVSAKDANAKTIEIFFVNDMQYGFYPINSKGTICNEEDSEDKCGGGLARLVKKLEDLFKPPKTTVTGASSTVTETTPSTTTPSTTILSTTTPSTTTPSTTTPSTTTPSTTTPSTTTPSTTTPSTTAPSTTLNNSAFYKMPPSDKLVYSSLDFTLQSNTLLINAGNSLNSHNNNWFDLLKFQPAMEALESLDFSAIALGPDVVQYGDVMGSFFTTTLKDKVVASNVEVSSDSDSSFAKDLLKSITFEMEGQNNVTVIGFMGKIDAGIYTSGINISDIRSAIANVIKEKKNENEGKHIFIAIGSVENLDVARNIAKIDGISIVIFSGGIGSDVSESQIYLEEVTQQTCWIASTIPPEAGKTHHILGKLTLMLNSDGDIVSVVSDSSSYMNIDKTDNATILDIEKRGQEALISMKETPFAHSEVALGGDESCNYLENVMGDIVTDAMQEAAAKENFIGGVSIWNPEGNSTGIEAKKNFTREEVLQVLGSGKDQNICTLSLNGKQLYSLLETALESQHKNDCKTLQVSGLYVEYGTWAEKGNKIQKISRVASNMTLVQLDAKDEKEIIKIALPAHLLSSPYMTFDSVPARVLGVTVGQAVIEYINKTMSKNNYVKLWPVGLRYRPVSAPLSIHKCFDNTGEAVLLTLAVIVFIGALGLLTWYVILPRIRQRRGSTMPLIY